MSSPVSRCWTPSPARSRRRPAGAGPRHEADYLVEVHGDLDRPALEWPKHTAYRWIGPDDLPVLKENRAPGEHLIHDLIAKALREHSFPAG
jgi:hypothetical protein